MLTGIANIATQLWQRYTKKPSAGIGADYVRFLATGYPSNHTYEIKQGSLKPKHKLASRYKKIRALLPKNLDSIAEVGCSKGFFIFSASTMPGFSRGLGIDVNSYNITVCNWVKEALNYHNTTFKTMQLHELAPSVQALGGPFQVVLILNTYQYLYFGSDNFPECYLDHDAIFKHLREICSGRIIFNNRIDLDDCQNTRCIALASEQCKANYSEEMALKAASKYFTIQHHGKIGKYPLITLDVK